MKINPNCIVIQGNDIGKGIESVLTCPSVSFNLQDFKDFNFKILINDKFI